MQHLSLYPCRWPPGQVVTCCDGSPRDSLSLGYDSNLHEGRETGSLCWHANFRVSHARAQRDPYSSELQVEALKVDVVPHSVQLYIVLVQSLVVLNFDRLHSCTAGGRQHGAIAACQWHPCLKPVVLTLQITYLKAECLLHTLCVAKLQCYRLFHSQTPPLKVGSGTCQWSQPIRRPLAPSTRLSQKAAADIGVVCIGVW